MSRRMKILLLSNVNSVHTIKWALSLSNSGVEIVLFSLEICKVDDYINSNIKIITPNLEVSSKSFFIKVGYLTSYSLLQKTIKIEKPDILHAHYASSYGLIGSLTGFSPFILSVWGSDVFSFPKKSFFHKSILKYNLSKADKILSTSKAMAKETNIYTNKNIEITPFGIDTQKFKPMKGESFFLDNDIVIGTIKSLEEVYGIEYLIRAFKIILDKNKGNKSLKLLIIGGGSLEKKLKKITEDLNISKNVTFKGRITFDKIPLYHNMIDIFVAASLEESFGVSIIEASAASKPVVVTNVGGLPEVVENGKTGFVVPERNSIKLAEAIEKLILDNDLRKEMGVNGRKRVKQLYDWEACVSQMISIYKQIIQ